MDWIRRRSKVELGRRGRDQKPKVIDAPSSSSSGSGWKSQNAGSRSERVSSPGAPKTQKEDGFCAFCFDLDGLKRVNHQTPECHHLKPGKASQNVDRKWEALKRKATCVSCLKPGHESLQCDVKAERCGQCRVNHHVRLLCRPSQRSSQRNPSQQHNSTPLGTSATTSAMGVIDPRKPPCYSRTCPVRISHPYTGRSKVGLAIIDDQSGVTFVSPSIKRFLTIPESSIEASTQSVITIEGPSSPRPCEIIHNLTVSPLTGNSEIELPPSVMQNPIPNAWD